MKTTVKKSSTLLDAVMGMMIGASATAVRRLIKNHRVTIDGEVQARPDTEVQPGQTIEISHKEQSAVGRSGASRSSTIRPSRKKGGGPVIRILHEDEHIIVVDKPAGMLSIATDKEREKTLYWKVMDYARETTGGEGRIFIVHRLDRDASGVMVFAKDEPTKRALQKNWANAVKVYHAVVEGKPKEAEGTIENHLCENKAMRVYVCDKNTEGAQKAVTHYRVLSGKESRRLLEVRIETGRKHQIRVHMASTLGCPITGDEIYGMGKIGSRGLALHSHSLTFEHPVTGKRMTFQSPVPERFRKLI